MSQAQQKVEFVYATLVRRIRTGFWRTGEVIPAEIDLASEFRCSRGTVNRAVSRLAKEGWVERRTRAGTRVVPPKPIAQPGAGGHRKGGGGGTWAFIYPNLRHEGIARVVAGFQGAAAAAGQPTRMLTTGVDFGRESEMIARLGEGGRAGGGEVRGIVVYPVIASAEDHLYYMQTILACPLPVVLAEVNLPGVGRPVVMADGIHAGREATRHLLAQGVRRIGFLANYGWVPMVRDRYLGYRQAMEEAGAGVTEAGPAQRVRLDVRMRPKFDDPISEPEVLAREYLEAHPDLEAVVCGDDFLAHGCLRVARQLGWPVPGRLRVIGIDGLRSLPATRPALTCYRVPFERIGAEAFTLLRQVAEAGMSVAARCPSERCVRGELVVRRSG
ncbi:GntR family transcriptional regulator [Opitutaceae bacterium TAV4]|nr:GntR family transcriptional regulator [Opitutaceae bacterium TAV4]